MTQHRIDALRTEMNNKEFAIDAMLITTPSNRQYMSGFTGSSGVLLITLQHTWLLTDFRYMTQAPEQSKAFEIVQHAPNVLNTIADLCVKHGLKSIGFEQDFVTYGYFMEMKKVLVDTSVELVATQGIVEAIRITKDEEELTILREAAEIVDQTYDYILKELRPGLREKEVAWMMEQKMRELGATGPSFETIVASGERSALPHGIASDRVIQSGEMVKLDFGAKYKGYCSDITRTVAIGEVPDELQKIYEIVRDAQETTLAVLRPGMTGREVDAIARKFISEAGYGENFGHGTGHGLGLDIHEAPTVGPRSEQVLKPGMVVTVEPGIYLPGLGGVRIEDDVIITENGIEVITKSPKAWTVLD